MMNVKTAVTVCRLSLGAVWFYEGLVPKLLFVRPDQVDLVRRSGIYFGTPEFFLQLLGAAQVAFAIWLLAGFAERMAVAIATVSMWILIVLVAMANPAMLTDPYGALIKDLCLTACAYTVWSLSPLSRAKHGEPMSGVIASRSTLSEAARCRMLALPGEPMLYARWDRAVFIHYAADPGTLQPDVPFELDLRNGRAFVSIVAFTLLRMRPRIGGRIGEWLFRPIATHEFLNVRTYVRQRGEPGIYFLAEWLSNPLSVRLGPRTFGLPYRFGRLAYEHTVDGDTLSGTVEAPEGRLAYQGRVSGSDFEISEAESLTEFMLERYTAFTQRRKRARFFRVWHSPWEQTPAEIEVAADGLIASTGAWWKTAECIGANYSPGAEVWMGRPHGINSERCGTAPWTAAFPTQAMRRGIPPQE